MTGTLNNVVSLHLSPCLSHLHTHTHTHTLRSFPSYTMTPIKQTKVNRGILYTDVQRANLPVIKVAQFYSITYTLAILSSLHIKHSSLLAAEALIIYRYSTHTHTHTRTHAHTVAARLCHLQTLGNVIQACLYYILDQPYVGTTMYFSVVTSPMMNV